MNNKTTIDLLDMFAAHALSGYSRGGVSYMEREVECNEVAEACYDLATAMLKVRQTIVDNIDSKTMRQG